MVAWYENQGNGSLGPRQVITTQAYGTMSVYAADLDGDGDSDVLSASSHGDKIAWYENLTSHSQGSHHVTVRVEDGRGGSGEQSFEIDVIGRPPEIVSEPVVTAFAGDVYTYDVDAIDPDDDPLAYSLVENPEGMTIDSDTGLIDWSHPLLDAEIDFTSQFGFPGTNSFLLGSAMDAAGNAYIAGYFEGSGDFDRGPGTHPLSSQGDVDAFVVKYDPEGTLVWAKSVGGPSGVGANDVAVDDEGNVYLYGVFKPGEIDADPGAGQHILIGEPGQNAFLIKLDSQGDFVWARHSSRGGYTSGRSIDLDGSGNIYLTGDFGLTVDFDPGPGVQSVTTVGEFNGFVQKLDSEGNFLWVAPIADADDIVLDALAVDDSGIVYAGGRFEGTVDFDPGPGVFELTSAGSSDLVVLKLDTEGHFVWAKSMGGPESEDVVWQTFAYGLALDDAGDLYYAAQFRGTGDFDPGPGEYNLVSAGDADAVVLKLDRDGNFVWARRLGGEGLDSAWDLKVDERGNVYTTGSYAAPADFDPGPGSFELTDPGWFLSILDSDGDFVWAGPHGAVRLEVHETEGIFLAAGLTLKNLDFVGSSHPVTVRVEDGRGGSDEQSFTIDVVDAEPGEIHGTKFKDVNGDGVRGTGMVGLGDLPGGDYYSAATDVSADGSVVVGLATSAAGVEPFRWTSDGGMVGLGYLPGGSSGGIAYGVSADGSVVVGHCDSASSGMEAFRWTSDGGMVGLGNLPGGSVMREANDVSPDGSVIVGDGNFGSGNEAFIWDATNGVRYFKGVLTDLGLDLTGWTLVEARGISADGLTVAGIGINPLDESEAWIANLSGAPFFQGLGDLSGGDLPEDDFRSAVFNDCLSDDGSVVVGYSISDSGTDEAFRWTSGGGMVGLGNLRENPSGSRAYGVSANGSVVVGYGGGVRHIAIRWSDLNGNDQADPDEKLDNHPEFVLESGVFNRSVAYGASVDGSVVVGHRLSVFGDFVFAGEAFRWTSVEPGLEDWVIYLDQNQNDQRDPDERWTTTDADGDYSFTNLPPGTYYVVEEQQIGWEQTAPTSGLHEVTITDGEVVTDVDFGNKQGAGEIHGTKFNDLNGDGLQKGEAKVVASGAPFVDPVAVAVSPDGNTLYVTDYSANAVFRLPVDGGTPTLLASGPLLENARGITISPDGKTLYIAGFGRGEILSVPVAGGQPTVIASGAPLVTPHGIAVSPDGSTLYIADHYAGAVFSVSTTGGQPTVVADGFAIPGPAFLDISTNGKTLYLSTEQDGIYAVPAAGGDPVLISPSTNFESATSIALSEYENMLLVVDSEYWKPNPDPKLYGLPFVGGDPIVLETGLPFAAGGWLTLSSDGRTLFAADTGFLDRYQQGPPGEPGRIMSLRVSEPGLAGWTIYLDQNQNGVRDPDEQWTTTDAYGSYSFTHLTPGTYYVREEEKSGWLQTSPPGGVRVVVIPEVPGLGTPSNIVTTVPEFQVSVFAEVDNPGALAFAPQGSPFGNDLFVAGFIGDYEANGPETIYRVSLEPGTVSSFATLPAEADPVALEFPPADSLFGEYLYVTSNNRDGGRPGDYGGTIQRIDTQAVVTDFTPIGLPDGFGEPAGLAFAPSGAFGGDLFVPNGSDPPMDIGRVDPSGEVSIFFEKGLQPGAPAFGRGGDWGTDLYFTDGTCNCIRIVDSSANVSGPFVTMPGPIVHLRFAASGAFGNALYAAGWDANGTASIFRIQVDGTIDVIASGFEQQAPGWLPAVSDRAFIGDVLEFSPDGDTLFVSNVYGDKIYAITANSVVTGIDFGNQQIDEPLPPPPENRAPDFTSNPLLQAEQGALYRYDASAYDADGDTLTYDLVVKPAGMAIATSSGVLVWQPAAGQVGTHDVTLRVQDGHGGVALQPFQVTVTQANSGPVITSRPTGPAVAGFPWQYQVAAQDADDDPITFSLDGPVGMAIGQTSGLVTWTPTTTQADQSHHVAITASDGRGAQTTQFFDLPVVASAPNDRPQITSTPRATIRLGGTYFYQIEATDPNSDPLTYASNTGPVGMQVDQNGLVSWEPQADQFGANPVEIRVEDGRGGIAVQGWSINVVSQDANLAPSITSTPPQAATVGRVYAYETDATDPDGDPLTWSLDVAPTGMSIDADSGDIRWTPAPNQIGSNEVAIRVLDAQGAYATQTYTITVRSVNVPPGINSTPPTTAYVDEQYVYAVRATDPENNPLTFSLTTSPAGMSIDPNTGYVEWIPTATQATSHDVAILVEDGQGGSATQTYTVEVGDAASNEPPVITSSPVFAALVDDLYQYQVAADDPDGDTPEFLLLLQPDGMSVNSTTGLISWIPTIEQLGEHQVVVAAFDPLGQGGTQSYTVTVFEDNDPPDITSSPNQVVYAGLPYRYDVAASDPDGDPITYALDAKPDGMQIDPLGRVTWSPQVDDVGIHSIEITVADDRGLSVTQGFDLAVIADQQTPRIDLFVSSNPALLGTPVTFVVTATDNVGVEELGLNIDGQPVPLDAAGRITLLAEPVGQYSIYAYATDAADNTGTATTTLSVIDTSDQNAPHVFIESPADYTVVTAPVEMIGTVDDPEDNLLYYTVSTAPMGSDEFTEMFRGTTEVTEATGGRLGTFDPTGLANGTYRVRLTAFDGQFESSIENVIEVAGDLKIGNFTLSFTDLSIPVSGIPIMVTRTYDTLTAGTQNDLGYGWRLEFRDTDLRTSVASLGEFEEELGYYAPFREGSRVYVTVPGGRRQAFTFQPTLAPGFAGSFWGYREPAFVPDPGVTSRLSVPNYTLMSNEFREYFSPNGLAYNPMDALNFGGVYYLTTEEGLLYEIDAKSGDLSVIGDTNGNSLTFSDTSIDHSAGPRVTFDRDPQGRIIAVNDPVGNQVQYAYDAAGDLTEMTDRDDNVTQFVYDAPRAHYLTEVIDPWS
jgi:YD repeat-containing protein/probable HAF family extracellular repeat protein